MSKSITIKAVVSLLETTLNNEMPAVEADSIVESCVVILRSLVAEEPSEDGPASDPGGPVNVPCKMKDPFEGIALKELTFTCLCKDPVTSQGGKSV